MPSRKKPADPPPPYERRSANEAGAALPEQLVVIGALRLNSILASMSDALVAVSPSGTELLRNPAFDRFSSQREVLVEDETGVVAEPALPALFRRAAQGESFAAQLRSVDSDGQPRWMEAVGQPFTEHEQGGLVMIRDITERRLRRLQEESVAILAHELRTPLTALQGYLQMLVDNPADAERLGKLSLDQLERMRRLIADLFDTARIETGTMRFEYEDISLERLVRDTVSVAQTLTQRQQIDLQSNDGRARVRADPRRIQQVLLNVITNAITHAPESESIDLRLWQDDSTALIEIQDQGPGVSREELDTLFDRFRSPQLELSSTSGLGLGLFISRQIVAAHGGTIEADSKEGNGLTVRIRLPLAKASRRTARDGGS